MNFYTAETGVAFSVTWKDEEECRRAKAFATELAGLPAGRESADAPEHIILRRKNSAGRCSDSSANCGSDVSRTSVARLERSESRDHRTR
jgi:hypothetical protein